LGFAKPWAQEFRGALSAGGALDLSFNYIARTPEHKAKIVAKLSRAPAGIEFQIDSLDTGWSSGPRRAEGWRKR
jgi:molecular chaperone DnaK